MLTPQFAAKCSPELRSAFALRAPRRFATPSWSSVATLAILLSGRVRIIEIIPNLIRFIEKTKLPRTGLEFDRGENPYKRRSRLPVRKHSHWSTHGESV